MAKKCRISKYNVIINKNQITYGFRCGPHKLLTRRYSTEALRDQRLQEHLEKPKKSAQGY